MSDTVGKHCDWDHGGAHYHCPRCGDIVSLMGHESCPPADERIPGWAMFVDKEYKRKWPK